jgi:hypothetical protein
VGRSKTYSKKRRKPAPRFPSGAVAKMRELRAQGWSYRQIADHFGTDEHTAYNHTESVKVDLNGTPNLRRSGRDTQQNEVESSHVGQIRKLVEVGLIKANESVMSDEINRRLFKTFNVSIDSENYKAIRAALLQLSGPQKMFDVEVRSQDHDSVLAFTLKPPTSKVVPSKGQQGAFSEGEDITKTIPLFKDRLQPTWCEVATVRFEIPGCFRQSLLRFMVKSDSGSFKVMIYSPQEHNDYYMYGIGNVAWRSGLVRYITDEFRFTHPGEWIFCLENHSDNDKALINLELSLSITAQASDLLGWFPIVSVTT